MDNVQDILSRIRHSANRKILFLPHALRQMSRPDRMITPAEIRDVINHGEIIENYPEDNRGHSDLILGYGAGQRPIHVVCSPKEDFLAIITAYIPNTENWSADFRERL
jgi:hypothetical protein